jgi:glycerol-3-phosphate O-acyltransferase
MRAQRRNVGVAQVRFGEPLSLRQTLAESGEENRLGKVAFAVSVAINSATPVSATSLVTLALLGVRDRALTLEQVHAVVAPLLDDVERRKLPGSGPASLRRPQGIKRVLDRLAAEKVVTCFTGGTEPVYSIEAGQHHVAAFYRNGSVHWFVNRSIVELSTLHVAEAGGGGFAAGFEEALRLRDLLKFEFFFADKREFREQLRAELDLVDPNWTARTRTPEDAMALLSSSGSLLAHRVLRSFFDAQLVVAERLAARDPRSPVETDAFLKECMGVGRQMLLQGRIHGPEAVSRELFANALKLAANRDLVDPGRDELRERREAFATELRDVVARVERIGQVDEALRSQTLDAT